MTEKRKQLSGYQKRRLKALKSERAALPADEQGTNQVLLPRVVSENELASLTGTARESARCYREWRQGHLSWSLYLVAVKGITAHTGVLTALETERQRQEIELLRASVERVQTDRGIGYTPTLATSQHAAGDAIGGAPLPTLNFDKGAAP